MVGRTMPGDVLEDWTLPHGFVREVVEVTAGRMPTPIDPTIPPRGSTAGQCALFAVTRHPAHLSIPTTPKKLKGAL